jgi:hypothetical protein
MKSFNAVAALLLLLSHAPVVQGRLRKFKGEVVGIRDPEVRLLSQKKAIE